MDVLMPSEETGARETCSNGHASGRKNLEFLLTTAGSLRRSPRKLQAIFFLKKIIIFAPFSLWMLVVRCKRKYPSLSE